MLSRTINNQSNAHIKALLRTIKKRQSIFPIRYLQLFVIEQYLHPVAYE